MTTYRNNFESGRSMVEILGTLALAGVLSVMGLIGYRYLIDGIKANTILNEVNKRAYACITQFDMMGQNVCNIGDFPEKIDNTYPTTVFTYYAGYFGFKIENVSEGVCKQIHFKGFPNAILITPTECTDTNSMQIIMNVETKHKCTPQTVAEDCSSRAVGNACGSDGYCKCSTGQTLTPTGCAVTTKLLNDAYCHGGVTTDETTGEKQCCWGDNYTKCCPYGKVWINGECKDCSDPSVLGQTSVYYCRVCPQRARSYWKCRTDCVEEDQVIVGGECRCPFSRPIMLQDGKCYTCESGGQTLNGSNVPLGYTREQIARYCNYRGGYGGYSYPCTEAHTVGLWYNTETYNDGTGEKVAGEVGHLGECVPCAYVTTEQLNSRARCEACDGTWQSSAPNTQNEWASGSCTCNGTWNDGVCT